MPLKIRQNDLLVFKAVRFSVLICGKSSNDLFFCEILVNERVERERERERWGDGEKEK
jgi:hypothetical protein